MNTKRIEIEASLDRGMNVVSSTRAVLFCLILVLTVGSTLATAQQSDSEDESTLRFRFVGPKTGNRVSAIAGIPGDATT